MSGEYDRDQANGNGTTALPAMPSGPNSPVFNNHATASSPVVASNNGSGVPKAVDDVLYSDIGITTLLTRLKQSIASARDFAQFLKKRSALEEEQATGLKRLARAQLESIRKNDVRGGSYAAQLAEVLRVHERMADNGMQFALSLHQMHEDLDVLSNNMERGRKTWKHEGLDAEKKASDAEAAMQKAKAKYDSLAEDYDRARTGDTKGSRRIGLKGPKSAEQYEQDLLRKTQAADADYEEKVGQAKAQRELLVSTARPRAVRALQELIQECDSGLTLQLQKFATFNEKLLLGNGLAVSPLNDKDSVSVQRSLRDLVTDVDNDRDFHNYVSSFSGRIQPPTEIKYEQHPLLAPKSQQSRQAPAIAPVAAQAPLTVHTAASQPGSVNNRFGGPQSASQTALPYQSNHPHDTQQSGFRPNTDSPYQAAPPNDGYGAPPYPTHPTDRAGGGAAFGQQIGSIPIAAGPGIAPNAGSSQFSNAIAPASGRPVFGVSLDTLFARDGSAVPMIVFQCMQAVDLFGLDVEGIYRVSGTTSHTNALRNAFDTLPPSAPQLDFRNPANFFHDVNSVTSLLKQFFRELPDPLFTRAGYDAFIAAAKIDEDDRRRDALHQGINDLPDPNYATLRALVLHLWRVMQHESRTRMSSANLAVCFAPSLMGQHTTGQIADAGLQAKVLDTILMNATAIFDED